MSPELPLPQLSLSQFQRRDTPLPFSGLLALLALLGFSYSSALVRLGEPLPPHPWADETREIVVVYTHDCGDLGPLWQSLLQSGLPVRAVNAEDVPAAPPQPLVAWRGQQATDFARTLRVGTYPAVLLVNDGRILNAWEGDFTAQSAGQLTDQ